MLDLIKSELGEDGLVRCNAAVNAALKEGFCKIAVEAAEQKEDLLCNVAGLLHRFGDHEQSLKMYEKVCNRKKEKFEKTGSDHSKKNYAIALGNLADAHQ